MTPYFITIIIIIVCLEIYLRYYIKSIGLDKKKLCSEITSIVHEPWDKIDVDKDKHKYYIKINNFDENKFLEWKKLPIKIDYDVDNKYLIIKTKSEENALAIANLFISCMNNEIDFQYIVDNDMINISRLKAKTYKLVKKKLIELIKEGSNRSPEITPKEHFDTNEINYTENEIIVEKMVEPLKPIQNDIEEFVLNDVPIENTVEPSSLFSAYGGSEYATISF
jgi:hypothetical protein